MAKFKIDENMPTEAADELRAGGHDCDTVFDEGIEGAEDPDVAAECRLDGRILVTLDVDFSDVRSYRPGAHPGIILLRPGRTGRAATLNVLRRVLRQLEIDEVEGSLWVCTETAIRVRSPH